MQRVRETLIEARLALGMTQATLAREAGVHRATVIRAEAGEEISKLNQAAIARVIGKTRAELFGDAA